MGTADADEPMDRVWKTGFFKEPVESSVWASFGGLAGDGQADLKHHGGPDKAINVYPSEHYEQWSTELNLELLNGAFGENFTSSGLMEDSVCVGDVFAAGDLRVQVTHPRQPCWKLSRRWRIKDLAARVECTGRTGWYLRVLNEGGIQAGASLELVERPSPRWSIRAANEVMHRRKNDFSLSLELAACPQLSASWKATLANRATSGAADSSARLQDPEKGS